ncbi:hypothetical protein MVEN_02253300 [Mycena venus]|uniref:F-box domain-containing protein n=1 Tax=Mycena venus TaxID=2733690 RepID=A0A8H6X6J5_9AGAR|nr:hypothetical protein MVEN_02253300 [Mycena venus]
MSARIFALDLPFELISQIFVACLPLRRRVRPHRRRAPLNLASICSQWRAIAIATPELWASVYLEFHDIVAYDGIQTLLGFTEPGPLQEPFQDNTAALIHLWFTRAAGHTLSISLICTKNHRLPCDVLEAIEAFFPQWGRIELGIPMADFIAFNRIAGPFPSLRSLSIQVTDRLHPFHGFHIQSIFQSPQLQALQLRDKNSAHTFPNNPTAIPRTLTAFQIGLSSLTQLADLLGHLPRLSHLDLGTSYGAPLDGPSLSVSLDTLLVTNDRWLNGLIIPTRKHLDVWPSVETSLLTFLVHSQCHLTTLSLGYPSIYSTQPCCPIAWPRSLSFERCRSIFPTMVVSA